MKDELGFGLWRRLLVGFWVVGALSNLLTNARADIGVIALTSPWRYEQNSNLNGTNWQSLQFDDASWPSGNGLFGYDPNYAYAFLNTPLSIGRTTYYFRTSFLLPCDPSNVTSLTFSARIDDGAVFYLNGREIQRVRMAAPPAVITYTNFATSTPVTGDAILADSFVVSGTNMALLAGTNVLAVEVHQVDAASDDIVFGSSVTLKFTNCPPIVFAPPLDTAVLDGRPVSFSAMVDGNPTPVLQWMKNGAPIGGATSALLSIPAASFADAGRYSLVASNINGVTETVDAVLTVLPDTVAPNLKSTIGEKSLTNIALSFSEPLLAATATNPLNYQIFQSSAPSNQLNVTSAALVQGSNVLLVTTPRTFGVNYALRVAGIRDASSASNEMPVVEMPIKYVVDLVAMSGLAQWRYFQNGMLPATNWSLPDFDDSSWPLGSAPFQAGTSYSGTLLSLKAGTNNVNAYYFRTGFDLPGELDANGARLRVLVDDGAVFYLNGTEIYSVGMPSNRPVSYTNTATVSVGSPVYSPPLNVVGMTLTNVVAQTISNCFAAEVHQSLAGYSDVAFAASLEGVITHFYPLPAWSLPSVVLEGCGTLPGQARISIAEPIDNDLTLQLASSDPASISVSQAVTIPKGATNVVFDLVVGDDNLVNGPRRVTLTAQAAGGTTARGALTVLDDEPNTLTLVAPGSVCETNGSLSIEVRLGTPVVRDIIVALSSSDTNSIAVPSSVTIPSGATSAIIQGSVIDNRFVDGSRTVLLSASIAGWPTGTARVVVTDNESAAITVSMPASVVEGDGVLTNAGKIQLGGLAVSNLTVQLTSSLPGVLTVSNMLTIPAGQSNVSFTLALIDNSVPEPARTAVVSASISGFADGSNSVVILDDDPDHFEFSQIGSPQSSDAGFSLTAWAKDAGGNTVTNFKGSVTLTASSLGGALAVDPSVIGPFTKGVWNGSVRVMSPGRLVRLGCLSFPGTSNPFQVDAPPFAIISQPAADLAFHSPSGTLFASVPATGGVYSNKLVAINPATGLVSDAYPLGNNPSQIELSPDGTFLYAVISNRNALCRFDIASHQVTRIIGLGQVPLSQGVIYNIRDMAILGGTSDSLAVTLGDSAGNDRGVWRIDEGRLSALPAFGSPYGIEASPTDQTLYGYQWNNQRPLEAGIANAGETPTVVYGVFSGGGLFYKDGILFDNSGSGCAVDAHSLCVMGYYPGINDSTRASALPEVDPVLRRTFFLSGYVYCGGYANCSQSYYKIKAYDPDTFTPLRQLTLPPDLMHGESATSRFLRCGTNGLAFNTGSHIWIVRSETLQPTSMPADLVLTQTPPPMPVVLGSNVTFSLTVSNAGSGLATLIQVSNVIPNGVSFIRAAASTGNASLVTNAVIWNVDQIEPGASANLQITLSYGTAGWQTNMAVATEMEEDVNFSNNLSQVGLYVQIPPGPGSYVVQCGAVDLIYEPSLDRLIMSVTNGVTAGQSNGVAFINPNDSTLNSFVPLDSRPGRLARSSNGSFLYVSLPDAAVVRQFSLPDMTLIREFGLGSEDIYGTPYPYYAGDMAPVPGDADSLVVWQVRRAGPMALEFARGVALVKAGVLLSNVTSSRGLGNLEFDRDTAQIYSINGSTVQELALDSGGVTVAQTYPALDYNAGSDFEHGAGRMWTTHGRVLALNPFGVVGVLAGVESAVSVEPDAANSRVYYVSQTNNMATVRAYDMNSYNPAGAMVVSNVPGPVGPLVRWGQDGLAFTASNKLVLVRGPLVCPPPGADLALSLSGPSSVGPSSNATFSITVSNCGPQTATSLRLTNSLSSGATMLSAGSTIGVITTNSAQLIWTIPTLEAGSNAVITLVSRAPASGAVTLAANIDSDTRDPWPGNNTAISVATVGSRAERDSVLSFPLATGDLVYNSITRQLYATVPARIPNMADSLVAIDPESLAVRYVTYVGPQAGKLTQSDDSTKLYAAIDYGVQTIEMPAETNGSRILIDSTGGQTRVMDMGVLPGKALSLAVLDDQSSGRVMVFDNGLMRQSVGLSHADTYGEALVVGGDPAMVCVQNFGVAGFESYAVNSDGTKFLGANTTLNPPFKSMTLKWGGGRVFTSLGTVIDPVANTKLTTLPGIVANSALAYDGAKNRVYYLCPNGSNAVLRVFETENLNLVGAMTMTNVPGTPSSLVRWGDGGLAFRTSTDQIFVLRTSLVPSDLPADLALATTATDIAQVSSNFSYTITVTNCGPNTAGNVSVRHQLPPNAVYISGTSSSGTGPVFSNGIVRVDFGSLTNGETAKISITAASAVGGLLESVTTVFSDSKDPNLTNNTARATTQVLLNLAADSFGQIAINATDIAYNPFAGLLYAGGGGNQISVLNPATGGAETAWPVPGHPNLLRLSKDGTLLYCSFSGTNIARLATGSGSVDFTLGVDAPINDLKPMPSAPASFVAAWGMGGNWNISVWDGQNPRSRPMSDSAGARCLEFGSEPDTVYAVASGLSGYSRYRALDISSNGISEGAWNESLPPSLGNLKFDGGRMYAASGEVLDVNTGVVIGKFSGTHSDSLVEPETDRQRVYFLNKSNAAWNLQAYDTRTLAPFGSMTVSNILGTPTTLLRWGSDGFAFCTTSNQLFLIRTSLVPSAFPAGLFLAQTAAPNPVTVGSNLTFTVTVTNSGPDTVSNLTVFDRMPTNTHFVSATVSQGAVERTADLLNCAFGALAPGACAQLQLTVQPLLAGDAINVAASPQIALQAGDSSSVCVHVQLQLGLDEFGAISLNVPDMVYCPARGLIYAISGNPSLVYSNCVVAIDPATGLIGPPVFSSAQLTHLAVTDDGSRLLALAQNGKKLVRVNLSSGEAELEFPFNASPDGSIWSESVKAVPGQPESELVVLQNSSVLWGAPVVTVFDGAVARPRTPWFGMREVEFYSPDHLMGFEPNSVPSETYRVALYTNGADTETGVSYLVDGDMSASGGLIYTSNGSVIDPETMMQIRSFGVTGPVAPDSDIDRVAFLTGSGSSQTLKVFDTHDLQQWGSLTISNIAGTPSRLIRCGADRFAFRTSSGQVFIVRSSAIPTGKPSDLALGMTVETPHTAGGSPLVVTLTVTNFGPSVASNVVVSITLPPLSVKLLSYNSSQGSVDEATNSIRWLAGCLASGGVVTNRLAFESQRGGAFEARGYVSGDSGVPDPKPDNNFAQVVWLADISATNSALSSLSLSVGDMVWEPLAKRLLVSVQQPSPVGSNCLLQIDPVTGQLGALVPVGSMPNKLAVSGDERYAYVGMDADYMGVAKVDLQTGQVVTNYGANDVAFGYVSQIVLPPSLQQMFIVLNGASPSGNDLPCNIDAYLDGNELPAYNFWNYGWPTSVTKPTATGRLYGYCATANPPLFFRMAVTSDSLTLQDSTPGLLTGDHTSIEYSGQLVFASSGTVLDPKNLVVITNIPDISSDALCKPDVSLGFLTFLTRKADNWFLRQYSHGEYSLAREMRIPGIIGQPRSLTRWGTDGLAFLTTSNQVFLVRPGIANADLAIQPLALPTQTIAAQPIQISFTLSNGGPSLDPDAFVTNTLLGQAVILSAQASRGTNQIAKNNVIFHVGEVQPGELVTLEVTLCSTNSADVVLTNIITAAGAFVDCVPSNNFRMDCISASADTDRDGIPDYWMKQYFGHPTALQSDLSRPSDDFDHDGMSNLKEFLAGTNPADAKSVFKIATITANSDGTVTIAWSSRPGNHYTLERSDSLLSAYTPFMSNILASDFTNSVSCFKTTNQLQLFRVRQIP